MLLNLSQYLLYKFHYGQRLPPQEVPKILMEISIDYLGACHAQRLSSRVRVAGCDWEWLRAQFGKAYQKALLT